MSESKVSRLAIDRARGKRAGRRWWPSLIALALAAGAASAAAISGKFERAVTVETATVTTAYPSQAMTTLNANGYVVAQRKAALSSKATGRLEWLGVVEGSEVKTGQTIARLESQDVEVAREQAAANLRVALANLEVGRADLRDAIRALQRSRELVARQFISEAAHDLAVTRHDKADATLKSLEAAVAVARAHLKAADVAIEQTIIRAPFDGIVLSRNANVGDHITSFSNALETKGTVVTLADTSTLEIDADVSEATLGRIQIGQAADIQLDAIGDRRFRGEVRRIVPTVDRTKATVLVKVALLERDHRVLPDMTAKVAFLERAIRPDETKPLTVVPAAAVVNHDGTTFGFIVKEGRARRTELQTGRRIGQSVEVHGVNVGDKIVLKPLDRMADGGLVDTATK